MSYAHLIEKAFECDRLREKVLQLTLERNEYREKCLKLTEALEDIKKNAIYEMRDYSRDTAIDALETWGVKE